MSENEKMSFNVTGNVEVSWGHDGDDPITEFDLTAAQAAELLDELTKRLYALAERAPEPTDVEDMKIDIDLLEIRIQALEQLLFTARSG